MKSSITTSIRFFGDVADRKKAAEKVWETFVAFRRAYRSGVSAAITKSDRPNLREVGLFAEDGNSKISTLDSPYEARRLPASQRRRLRHS